MDILRTLIVTSDDADLARTITATLDPRYQDMYRTPLSPTGTEPATHFITSGLIGEGFANLVPFAVWQQQGDPPEWVMVDYEPGDSFALLAMCEEKGLEVTLEEIEDLFADSDVTNEDPFVAMGRLGLKLAWPAEPVETDQAVV